MAFYVDFSSNERWVQGTRLDAEDAAFLRSREPANPIDTLFRYGDPPRPLRAQFTSTHKTIGHFVPVHGRWAVSPEVKALIEGFEPGVHEFVPVEIARPRSRKPIMRLDGTPLDVPYYLFDVRVMLDAVWIERSDVEVRPDPAGGPPRVLPGFKRLRRLPGTPHLFQDLVLHREVTAGHHAWRGGRQLWDFRFFSDGLAREVEKRRLHKIEMMPVPEE